jgi:hypothetical protein
VINAPGKFFLFFKLVDLGWRVKRGETGRGGVRSWQVVRVKKSAYQTESKRDKGKLKAATGQMALGTLRRSDSDARRR